MKKKDYRPPDNVKRVLPQGADNLPEVLPAPAKVGRPSLYEPRFCEMIVEHMKQGYSATSFGAVIDVSGESISEWQDVHPEFADAVKRGKRHMERFYTQMGQMIATGQFRRVVKEEPLLDASGKHVRDANGEPAYKREYAPAHTNAASWIFLTKNLLHWRDRLDVELPAKPPEQENPNREKLEGRFLRLVEKAIVK
jgi:hypothetical protein